MFGEVVKRTEGNRHSILVLGRAQGELSWNEKLGCWDPDKGWAAGGALLERGPELSIRSDVIWNFVDFPDIPFPPPVFMPPFL